MPSDPSGKAVIVAGPTASGKSALALGIAREVGGVVINADSMQVYDGLRVLTARPSPDDEARVPHRLYGVLSPREACSAGRWRQMAVEALGDAWRAGLLPVVVGGTGLYLGALMTGLSPIPEIPADIRRDTRERFARLGNEAFHAALTELDPVMAARLHPGNSQRLMRAYEVMIATGRSQADWQADPPAEPAPARFLTILADPPRDELYARCDARFAAMVAGGALDEVRALTSLGLDPALPAMRALGVAELADCLAGRLTLEEAVVSGCQATRRYAKRQTTWFRHQMSPDYRCVTKFSESLEHGIIANIRQFLLTTTD